MKKYYVCKKTYPGIEKGTLIAIGPNIQHLVDEINHTFLPKEMKEYVKNEKYYKKLPSVIKIHDKLVKIHGYYRYLGKYQVFTNLHTFEFDLEQIIRLKDYTETFKFGNNEFTVYDETHIRINRKINTNLKELKEVYSFITEPRKTPKLGNLELKEFNIPFITNNAVVDNGKCTLIYKMVKDFPSSILIVFDEDIKGKLSELKDIINYVEDNFGVKQ